MKKRLQEITERFCDDYCRFARQCTDQDELDETCEKCPMNELFEFLD